MSRHKNTKKFPHLKQSERAAQFFAKCIRLEESNPKSKQELIQIFYYIMPVQSCLRGHFVLLQFVNNPSICTELK